MTPLGWTKQPDYAAKVQVGLWSYKATSLTTYLPLQFPVHWDLLNVWEGQHQQQQWYFKWFKQIHDHHHYHLDLTNITVQFSVLEISKTVKVNVIWIKVAPVLKYKVQKLQWWWDICHNKVEIFAKLRLRHFVQWQQRVLTFWANMIIAGAGWSQINSLSVYQCRPKNSLPQQLQSHIDWLYFFSNMINSKVSAWTNLKPLFLHLLPAPLSTLPHVYLFKV